MTFDLDDLPLDWSVWRVSDGWVVGEVYDNEWDGLENLAFYEKGRGQTVAEAFAAAQEYERQERERHEASERKTREEVASGIYGLNSTLIGEPMALSVGLIEKAGAL